MSLFLNPHRTVKFSFVIVILGFLVYGDNQVEAQVKVLSNSRHAYGDITNTIDQLLGAGHVGTDIIVDSTSMSGDTFSGGPAAAINPNATYYDHTGAMVSSSAPYGINTTSYTGYTGDNVTIYNQYVSYDMTYNYAFTVSTNSPPPIFHTAPGNAGWGSSPGIEWTIPDGPEITFGGTSLSELTARNAGLMAVIKYNHPSWNWLDVKASLRQTASNWNTGYNSATYGFGVVSYASSTALTDGEIKLQPPVARTTTNAFGQNTFTLYPYKQTRRVKEVLFQFDSNPGFQPGELSLNDVITTHGGTKIMEYSDLTATSTLAPIITAFSDKYFAWFTADDANDNTADFSRIDTYSVLGPLSQNQIEFHSYFNILTPTNNSVTSDLPTFTWSEPSSYFGISKYQLYIDGSLHTDNITGTTTTIVTPLSDGSHTWYIVAVNGNGATSSSQSTRTIQVNSGYTESQIWYVDNVLGNDLNDGSESSPWGTIAKAVSVAQPGNTVIIVKNDGVPYREDISPTPVALGDPNITFRGIDAQNKPDILGSQDVSHPSVGGWTAYGGGNPNTYQKSIISAGVLATGPSINSLEKKVRNSTSQNSLNEGEWYSTGVTVYYRLDTGEDINTLHIEAGKENYGLFCLSGNTFKDLVVKYTNQIGVLIADRCIGEGLEVADNGATGVYFYNSSPSTNTDSILRYSTIENSSTNGVYMASLKNAQLYNNVIRDNGIGINVNNGTNDTSVRNNILIDNTKNIEFNIGGALTNFVASNNNWSNGTVDSHWINTFQGTDNQASTSPLFVDLINSDFSLQSFSPNIDTGIDVSLTSDILGNPIYGTPDIGAYEYQPPFTIGSDNINVTSEIRIYADGKYRHTTATSSSETATLSVSPIGGFGVNDYAEYMDISINTWEPDSEDAIKSWTATSSYATSTVFTISGLATDTDYDIKIDGSDSSEISGSNCDSSTCSTDSGGTLSFTYTGSWSTHVFSVERSEVIVPPAPDSGGGGSGGGGGGSSSRSKKENTETENVASSTQETKDLDKEKTRETLLLKIDELKKLITVLRVQLTERTHATTGYVFTKKLEIGDDNNDVLMLQKKLNALGFHVSPTGPGSYGFETTFYGSKTTEALRRFQCYYNIICFGTTGSTGYGSFGPQTRAKMNEI
ncbi:MAG: right-handed parallel beta-helix repeat-containing protein [Candidatus Nomurabacteria bacterium]|nr:MAG: right-handed parallel beta-helix repeat-containing protein [Candidatus Nomurabacteria bacterium]